MCGSRLQCFLDVVVFVKSVVHFELDSDVSDWIALFEFASLRLHIVLKLAESKHQSQAVLFSRIFELQTTSLTSCRFLEIQYSNSANQRYRASGSQLAAPTSTRTVMLILGR
ncbi:hypothetical protein R3P38DRAFT_3170096 [Favolaschia claudopus]|uniref:Secreted protein n=1 Tax=Favolaschia claudopus TaxID=2862362 RepID=A0AAW0DRV9_9AGAR